MEDMNDVQNIETASDGKQYIVVRIGNRAVWYRYKIC